MPRLVIAKALNDRGWDDQRPSAALGFRFTEGKSSMHVGTGQRTVALLPIRDSYRQL
jgi:hypothetical protein